MTLKKKKLDFGPLKPERYESHFLKKRVILRIKNIVLVFLGILAASFGLKGFLLPNHFIDGGVTGISMLLAELTHVPLPALIMIINIPFIFMGYKRLGLKFAIKTVIAITGLSLVLYFIQYPLVTTDRLLISVFGGFFLGLGIGLCMRGGCVIDGTEILSLHISSRTAVSVGDVILVINIVIFLFAALTIGLEASFYSLLTYLSASKTVDFVNKGLDEYIGVMIISPKSEQIRNALVVKLGKGVTVLKGQRGFGRENGKPGLLDIVYSVTTKLELSTLKEVVEQHDKTAFLIMHSVHDVKGGIIKKRPFH
jgi:uncharacterized membrane-anchored protein YitT (DUF2179 family)